MAAAGNYIVESDVDNWADSVSQTGTFVKADVTIGTEQIVVDIDVATGSLIRFTSTATLPLPLVYGTAYYAIRVDATTIKVATTPVNAAAGTAVNLTGTGTNGATHTINVGEGSSTADRQETIDRAETLIEQLTADYFYSNSFSIYLNGNGKNRLNLGFTAKILTVTGIELCGIEMAEDYFTNDDYDVYLDPELAEEAYPELHLRLRESALFPVGDGNIKVTGTIGWAACPPAIKQCAIILCRYENDSTLYQGYSPDVASEVIGEDYSYKRKDRYLTGVVEADRLIMQYVRKKANLRVL